MTQQRGNLVSIGESFHQWEAIGDMLAGQYLGSEQFQFTNGDWGARHGVNVEGQGVVTVLGTYQLNQKLAMVAPGGYVEITFVDEIPAKGGPSPLKVFRVETDSPQPAQRQPALTTRPSWERVQQGGGGFNASGMPTHNALPDPALANRPRYPQAPAGEGQQPFMAENPLFFTPDGTPVHGFTPDGTPLGVDGKIIPGGLGQ